jgi:uncharacterized membrane protein YcaP (DUF421 family)
MDKVFFSDWQSIIRIIIISILAYAALICILRLSGKRTLSKMSAFDLIVTIALGSTLSSVIINKSTTLSEGVLALLLLVMLQYVVTWLMVRNKKINNLVKSSPTLIVYNGKMMEQNMLKERIAEDEVYAALRENDISSLTDTDAVILETDGTLSVLHRITDPESRVITSVTKVK